MILTHNSSKYIEDFLLKVDAVANKARSHFLGDSARLKEYELAEAHALAYKDAGYEGDIPAAVKSWAEAKNWSGQQAADDIIVAVNNARTAVIFIRDIRLKTKEAIRNTTSAMAIQDIYDQYAQTMESVMASTPAT